MTLQIAGYAKLFVAHAARVRLLARVHLDVGQQIGARPERLAAVLARIVPFACVDPSMHHQRVLTREALATIFAHVSLHLAVPGDDVVFEIAPLPELEITFLALVGLDAGI